jgi:hypothetical protein
MSVLDSPLIFVLITALCHVESGGDVNAYNSDEEAAGILQIRPICLQDINRFSHRAYTLDDRYDEALSRMMAHEYLTYYGNQIRRIEKREPTLEDLSRIFNGGPTGYLRDSTDPYWEKVEPILLPLVEQYNKAQLVKK